MGHALSSYLPKREYDSMDMDHASSSSHPKTEHAVFLSFRGEDTRENFTSHLYAALIQRKINTFMDDSLDRGGEVSDGLLKAIKNSRLSIIVFSERYADSSWCLDELVHILECRVRNGQIVIPIFYHVDPSSVRKQQGKYGAALARLKSRYMDRLDNWRAALTLAAHISGWDSATIRPEARLVEAVVQDVIKKLRRISPSDDFEGLVGIHESNKEIESLLDIDSPKVLIVGIWGMGGIGKTTLAQVVFRRLSFEFEACFFLLNVREEWKKGQKKYYLQNKLFYGLLGEERPHLDTLILTEFDKERLRQKKVLIVLDDVDQKEQLEHLAGDRNWFAAGSRIIVTTRNVGVLGNPDAIFQVKELDSDEALHLFNLNAFKTNSSPVEYFELAKSFANHAKGIPLTLKVLGSTVNGKSKERWDNTLKDLKRVHNEILPALRISYDGLDADEKTIFLDIACFFKGNDKDFVIRILDGCGFSTNQIIEDLIGKSLLVIKESNKLWMHDLVEEMGRLIVREQSAMELGKRSRLWSAEDIYNVFKTNTETAAVEGIFLDMCRIQMVDLCPTAFLNTYNLRLLKLHSRFAKCMLQFPQGLQSLPDALRYLYWDDYPFKSLPLSFTGENLVELKLQYSKVEQLWEEVKNLGNLKVIDLSFSSQLIEIPNLSQAPNIESVSLRLCEHLREVPSYFQDLEKLTSLDLEDCSSLEIVSALPRNIINVNLTRCTSLNSLPRNIPMLKSLRRLELWGCLVLDYMNFPEILEFLEGLE